MRMSMIKSSYTTVKPVIFTPSPVFGAMDRDPLAEPKPVPTQDINWDRVGRDGAWHREATVGMKREGQGHRGLAA